MEKNISLNEEQLLAATHINGPMLVVAGPGSGKTHLLIERIINLINNGINAENILVITFSKKAALEMEARFKKRTYSQFSAVSFGTFHAVFFNILQSHGLYDVNSIIRHNEKLKYVEEIGIKLKITDSRSYSWQCKMLEKISLYKNIGEDIFEPLSGYFPDEDEKEQFLSVYKLYIRKCKVNRKLDFDDMVTECLDLFLKNQEIVNIWSEKYKYILIDEFQDINQTQYMILKMLEGKNHNVFAVGDDDQSIYGFRGASPGIMSIFEREHDNCKKVFLKINYRSAYEIIDAAYTCIRNNKNRMEREKQQVLEDRKPGSVITNVFENELLEAEFVSNKIKEILENKESQIAVIYRSDYCSLLIEEKLKSMGIDFEKNTKTFDFFSLKTVSIIMSYLKISIGCGTVSDYLSIINHPNRGITREPLLDCNNNNRNVFDSIKNFYFCEMGMDKDDEEILIIDKFRKDIECIGKLPLMAAFIYILKGIGLEKDLRQNYRPDPAYPKKYEELILDLKIRMSQFNSIEGFLKYVKECEENIESEKEGKPNEVDIKTDNAMQKTKISFLTAHASKGLEFSDVFVIGLQEGIFPHRRNLKDPAIEEERRLFYVAITRAKEHLYLCGRGSVHGKLPSRFIDEILNH